QGPCAATLEHELAVEASGWLAARCHGAALIPSRPAPQRVFAHTSAVAVRKPGSPSHVDAAVVKGLLAELEAMERWAREKARCDAPAQRERLRHVFADALAILEKRR
ncbi:MAG TPA: hypothetical protein VFE62_03340, partial [Gemmataceae bacterium]|nr:hypothetical protein [Gemmataceae bacterium]